MFHAQLWTSYLSVVVGISDFIFHSGLTVNCQQQILPASGNISLLLSFYIQFVTVLDMYSNVHHLCNLSTIYTIFLMLYIHMPFSSIYESSEVVVVVSNILFLFLLHTLFSLHSSFNIEAAHI